MNTKKRGLKSGIGIKALLQDVHASVNVNTNFIPEMHDELKHIFLKDILPGRYQPRQIITEAEIRDLADSIKEQGVLQPLILKPMQPSGYEIIAGERRFRASKLAGLTKVPAVIKDVSDEAAFAIALIENIQREQLNPIEEALAYERLVKNFALSHEKIAQMVGKSRSAISNSLRLINLDLEVKQMLVRQELEVGHAKVLLSLPAMQQRLLAQKVATKNLTVRELEALIQHGNNNQANISNKTKSKTIDPNINALEQTLSESLGAVIKILHLAKGNGKITINYNSLDELDGIIAKINAN